MGEQVRTALRGILIPDRYVTAYDPAQVVGTAATQAGPRAGRPVQTSTTATDLVLEGTGTQTGTVLIQTARGGYAEPDGAAFVWRESTSDTYRGWDVPCAISGWEHIVWTTGSGYRYPAGVVADDDSILVASSLVSGGNTTVVLHKRSASAGTWGTSGLFVNGASTNVVHTETTVQYLHPAMCKMTAGRLQLYHLVCDGTANLCQISQAYSDDDGNQWRTGARWVLESPISLATYTPKRIRVAYGNGQHCLVVWSSTATDEVLHQFASDDEGNTFELVAVWSGASGQRGGNPDLVYHRGRFVLVFSSPDVTIGSGYATKIARVGSAFTSFLDVDSEKPQTAAGADLDQQDGSADIASGRLFSDWDQSLCQLESGELLWYWRGNNPGTAYVARSVDGGDTWQSAGLGVSSTAVWYRGDAVTSYQDRPRHFHMVAQRGRVVCIHNWEANTATADWSLGAMHLGGYSTVTLPAADLLQRADKQTHWVHNWLPFELPGDMGWTRAVTGAATDTLTNGAVQIAGGLTTQLSYTYNASAGPTVAEGLVCRWRLTVNSGNIDWKIHNDDGSEDYAIEIRASTSTLTLRDQNAITQLAQATGLGGSYDVLVGMRGSSAVVWYREATTLGEDRKWVLLHAATGLTDGGGTLGAPRWQWGKLRTTPACNADVYEHHAVWDEYTGQGLGADLSRPDDLFPRTYSTDPSYVANGLQIRAVDGPTSKGDTWQVDPAYNYPASAVLPGHTASPRQGWRSTDTPGDMEIPFTRDDSLYPLMGGYLLGCYVDRINFPKFKIAGLLSSGWSELADVDCSEVVGFLREGSTVKPRTTSAGADGYYLAEDQLAGGYFYFPTSGDVRKIIGNSAGYWASGTVAEQRAILWLEGCDGGEDASGDAGQIWFPRALVTIAMADEDVQFKALRIEVDDGNSAPDPAEGYYTIGTLALGHIAVLGREYDWGYSHERQSYTEIAQYDDGTIRTSKRGPARRVYRIGYGEGVDVTAARGGNNSPDYVRATDASGAPPVGSVDTEPLLLDGLLQRLDGADQPIVFCPLLPVATGASGDTATVQLWDQAAGALYSRLTSSSVRLESVVGDDYTDELYRIATLEFTEIT